MNSKLLSASVLALAAMTAGSAFAEGHDPYPNNATFVGTKTRAEVQAELAQAQRQGFDVNFGRSWTGESKVLVSSRTRAELRNEVASSRAVSTTALERDYPVVQ